MKKTKKSAVLVFILTISIFFSYAPSFILDYEKLDQEEVENNPNSSANYLYKDKTYNITLEDVYDDENLTKIYTGANFQKTYLSGDPYLIWNETVATVDNNEVEYGDPDDVTMVEGYTDGTDNMKTLNSVATKFWNSVPAGTSYEMPVQWSDWTWTKGSGSSTGDLQYNDANNNVIAGGATAGTETYLGNIKPNGDTYTNWNEGDGAPHWSKLDEYPPDNNGDGGNIRETSLGVDDRWQFTTLTIPANSYVSKMVVYGYVKAQYGSPDPQTTWIDVDTSQNAEVSGSWSPYLTSYSWKSFTDTCDITQAELDAFWINVQPADIPPQFPEQKTGYCDIETVYVDVYYTTRTYSHDYYITWDVTNPDLTEVLTLYYDYRTTSAIHCDFDIYNWDTPAYEQITDGTTTGWKTGSKTLTDPYVSDSDQVRVRFQSSASSSNFNIEQDQLSFTYYTTDSYTNMNATHTITFDNFGRDLLAVDLESYHKTNATQTIDFKIWNFTDSSWITISSKSETATYALSNYTTYETDDVINGSGNLLLYYYGTSASQSFELQVDYLFIRLFYKMNLAHQTSFNSTGSWKYRWELIGSLQYTDWTYFEVVDPVPNFHAVSESSYTTRWILQNATLTSTEDLHDDISAYSWDLYGVSERTMDISKKVSQEAYTYDLVPDANYGTQQDVQILDGTWKKYGFVKLDYTTMGYLTENFTGDSYLSVWMAQASSGSSIKVYNTSDFDETTITWNTQPTLDTYQDSYQSGTINQWVNIPCGNPFYYYGFKLSTEAGEHQYRFYTKEMSSAVTPVMHHNVSKNYQGSGYMYMQTDTTEVVALRSQDYGSTYSLSSGDYFEVDFQTSSDSQINLILLNNGVQQKSVILSQSGNTNFNRHTVQISLDEDVEFDQLKFSSTFENMDNLNVWDVKTYKYIVTGDSADFYVSPINQRDVYLTPDNYTLRIYEQSVKKIETNVSIVSDGIYYVYKPLESIDCRITLFSLDGEYLQFEDYHISVNRSLNGEYSKFWLVDTIFSADEETYAYIEVYDRFNALVDTFSKLASSYIDLELDVYRLQIKSLLAKKTTLDINTTHVYELLSGDSLYFMLVEDYYQIGYYDEQNTYNQFIVYLDDNKAFELNSSYSVIYFSMFTYDGLGVDRDLVRFYINEERKDFGFNTIETDTADLLILDFFNNTLANETITSNTYDNSEYNIFVEIYSLNILNRFTYNDLIVNISQVGSGIYMEQLIPATTSLLYRFIPNINYSINVYYLNDTIYSTRTINLTSNNQIESFGIPTTPPTTPEYPKDVYFSIFNYDGLGLDHDMLKLYLDNSRKDFGFNKIENETVSVMVKDFFNVTLFSSSANMSGVYEYNIQITLYTVFIINNYNRTIQVEFERSNSSFMFVLGSRSGVSVKMLPNVTYTVTAYENNGTKIKSVQTDLDEEYVVIDFGFYDFELPVIPPSVINDMMLLAVVVVFFVACFGVALFLLWRSHKKYSNIPDDKLEQYSGRNNKKSYAFDNRLT